MKQLLKKFFGINIIIIGIITKIISVACTTPYAPPPIHYAELNGEIRGPFSLEEDNYFWKMSSISCDKNNSVYVADSGWNKIFVFNEEGKYLGSFGRAGQAPGEFLSGQGMNVLTVGVGNNDKIYVNDSSNDRISVFLSDMSLEGTYKFETKGPNIIDTPHVDSEGNILLVSYYKEKMIQIFDSHVQWKNGIMDGKFHFRDEYLKYANDPRKYFSGGHHVPIVINNDDHIYAMSNYALKIYEYDNKYRLINEIDLKNNKHFMNSYKQRIKLLRKRGGSFIICKLFLLHNDNIGVVYFNTKEQIWNIYSYTKAGILYEIIQIKEKGVYPMMSDHKGIIYCYDENGTGIFKFKKKEEL